MQFHKLARLFLLFFLVGEHHQVHSQDASDPAATNTSDVDQPSDLESRLAMVESQLARNEAVSSCRIFSTAGRSSLYGGIELSLLTANRGALSASLLGRPTTDITEPFDANVAPRLYGGYETARGLGFRTTYWQFDQNTDPSTAGVVTGLEMHSLDLEGTMHTQFHRADVMFSGGLRYGKLELDTGLGGLGALAFESEGMGPTIAAQLSRGLGTSNVSVYAGGRASILLTDNEVSIPGLLSLNAEESSMQVLEIRGGLEHCRRLHNCNLVTQIGGEVQNWQPGAIAGIIAPNVALYGPAFNIGLHY